MSRRPRRGLQPGISCAGLRLEAEVTLAAIKGEKTLAEMARDHDLNPNQITTWCTQLLEGTAGVFGSE